MKVSNSENSVVLHNLCHSVCEPQLSCINANAAVVFDFMLVMKTCSFAVQIVK